MRVGSLNLWGRFADWPRRLELLKDNLQAENLDVLFLQEACRDELGEQALEVAERLSFEFSLCAYAELREGVEEGVAILSRSPLVAAETHALGQSMPPRVMAAASIEAGEDKVRLATAHAVVRPAEVVRNQTKELLLSQKDHAQLVCGCDLNARPEEVSDIFAIAGVSDDLAEHSGITWPMSEELFRSAWAERFGAPPDFVAEPRRIDFILSRGLVCTHSEIKILGEAAQLASDHALVLASYKA